MLRYHYYIYNTHLFGILASVKKNNGDINNRPIITSLRGTYCMPYLDSERKAKDSTKRMS